MATSKAGVECMLLTIHDKKDIIKMVNATHYFLCKKSLKTFASLCKLKIQVTVLGLSVQNTVQKNWYHIDGILPARKESSTTICACKKYLV
jgi:hypothetical protein